jgi:hypothetical protein
MLTHFERRVAALADLVVVVVVGGGDLHAPGTEQRIGVLVEHQGDIALLIGIGQHGEFERAARVGHVAELDQIGNMRCAAGFEVVVLLLERGSFLGRGLGDALAQLGFFLLQRGHRIGMHRDRRVADHRLRTGGGDLDVRRFTRLGIVHRIAEMPEAALDRFVINLVVSHRGLKLGIPIHQPFAAKDQPVLEQLEEGVPHRPGQPVVEGETRARPIAGAAHQLELREDALFVLVFPIPDALDQGVAAEVVATLAFVLLETFLDDRLGGDPGMIGAGQPERVVPAHAVPTDENILERIVEGVAEVQRAGHVGWRNDDGEALIARAVVGGGGEALVLSPSRVD